MDMLTTLYDRLFAEVPTSHVGCFLFTMAIAEDLRNTFSMIKTLYYVPAVRLGRGGHDGARLRWLRGRGQL